jgi:putative endonuclease
MMASSGGLTRIAIHALDLLSQAVLPPSSAPAHSRTGKRGEEVAYFHLRQLGYVMVACNWRSARRRGELDLIGWDGDVLCFIEVKTRTTRAVAPAEAAVDREKQNELRGMARDYLRRLKQLPATRFDVVSVYFEKDRPSADITLFKNAFAMS